MTSKEVWSLMLLIMLVVTLALVFERT